MLYKSPNISRATAPVKDRQTADMGAQVRKGDRAYFACDKKIRGYFTILAEPSKVKKEKKIGILLELGGWNEIGHIKIKDFKKETGGQWRYFKKILQKIMTGDNNY